MCHSYCHENITDACVHHQPELKYRFRLQEFGVGQDFTYYILRYNVLTILLEGKTELTINKRKYVINAGEIFILPLFSMVTSRVISPVKVVSLTLTPDYFQLCLARHLAKEPETDRPAEEALQTLTCNAPVRSFLSNLLFCLEQIPSCRQFHHNRASELGLLLCLSYNKEELRRFLRPLFCKEYDFVHKLNLHLDHFVGVEDMARLMNMSLSVFNRMFREIFREPPYQWLLKQKSYAVLQYISTHTCTIKTVVDEFEFHSPSHFHRFCSSQYHCSPGELFKKLRQE